MTQIKISFIDHTISAFYINTWSNFNNVNTPKHRDNIGYSINYHLFNDYKDHNLKLSLNRNPNKDNSYVEN